MSGKYILDTNIVIPLFEGEQAIVEKIEKLNEVFIPAIVLGELFYGAYNSAKKETNLERINRFKQQVFILDCDEFTADVYGQIKKGLKDKGQPIPENDIWIAALAKQYQLTLVTRDRHFNRVENLNVEYW